MTNDNQHWQITDDEDAVPVRSATPQAKQVQSVSRKPAAIIGILLVVGIATLFLHDAHSMTGQVADTGKTVTIGTSGLDPVVVVAAPGETITWKNEQAIPHYLISNTLCNASNECMTTATVFPGDEVPYTVPATQEPGAYTYFSPTDPSLVGTISVGGAPIAASSSSSPQPGLVPNNAPEDICYSPSDCTAPEHCSVLDDGVLPGTCVAGIAQPIAIAQTSSTNSSEQSFTSEELAANPLLQAIQRQLDLDNAAGTTRDGQQSSSALQGSGIPGIPQNPYTIGNTGTPTYEANVLGSTAQLPFRQPSTGMGTWMAICAGLLAFFLVHRKAIRQSQHVRL